MRQLLEQLQRNTTRIEELEARYNSILREPNYELFRYRGARDYDAKWTLEIRKRVLQYRYAILENIRLDTLEDIKDKYITIKAA